MSSGNDQKEPTHEAKPLAQRQESVQDTGIETAKPIGSRHNSSLHAVVDVVTNASFHQDELKFTNEVVAKYGELQPMELAMLQAEKHSEEQQVNAQELLDVISKLNEREFALLSEATNKQLKSGLENKLMYNGSAWYLPSITDCKEDEPQNSIDFTDGVVTIALFGKKISVPLISLLTRAFTLVACWFFMWLALPAPLMNPGGYVFDPIVCFIFCSLCGGIVGRLTGVPPLIFVLGFSILWANVPQPKELVGGIVKDVRSITTRVGLTIILLRSGLAMSWTVIKPASATILALSFLPLLAEVLVHGFVATSTMDYGGDKLWPFLQAVVTAAGAPAVVGSTCLLMRTWGYGNTRGPGVILVPAVILDMVIAIWATNFMVGLVYRDENANLGWEIGQGPLQFFLGPIIGIIFGFIWFYILKFLYLEAKMLPHGKYSKAFISRTSHTAAIIFTIFGLALIFFGYKYKCAGGGALACTFLAASAQYLVTQEGSPEHLKIMKVKLYTYLTTGWDLLVMPALFSVGASSIAVKTMFADGFVGPAYGCIFAGAAARVVVTFVCSLGHDMTISERIISAFAYSGRATVQVALGPLALQELAKQPGGGTAAQKQYAEQVYDTSILAVIVLAPVSAILLSRVGPIFWLTDAEHARIAKEKEAAEAAPVTAVVTTTSEDKDSKDSKETSSKAN